MFYSSSQLDCTVLGIVLVCCPTGILGHSIYVLFPHFSHVSQHGKDDKARQKASQTVHRAGDQSISEMEKEEVWVTGRRQS